MRSIRREAHVALKGGDDCFEGCFESNPFLYVIIERRGPRVMVVEICGCLLDYMTP